mmetsp:Transcript_23887/g.66180  ORF Transcript_23887/g.66180 Transcript_23887/m.66180 type:complete len:206 (+) Transcript_23887:2361-2978(+)
MGFCTHVCAGSALTVTVAPTFQTMHRKGIDGEHLEAAGIARSRQRMVGVHHDRLGGNAQNPHGDSPRELERLSLLDLVNGLGLELREVLLGHLDDQVGILPAKAGVDRYFSERIPLAFSLQQLVQSRKIVPPSQHQRDLAVIVEEMLGDKAVLGSERETEGDNVASGCAALGAVVAAVSVWKHRRYGLERALCGSGVVAAVAVAR